MISHPMFACMTSYLECLPGQKQHPVLSNTIKEGLVISSLLLQCEVPAKCLQVSCSIWVQVLLRNIGPTSVFPQPPLFLIVNPKDSSQLRFNVHLFWCPIFFPSVSSLDVRDSAGNCSTICHFVQIGRLSLFLSDELECCLSFTPFSVIGIMDDKSLILHDSLKLINYSEKRKIK